MNNSKAVLNDPIDILNKKFEHHPFPVFIIEKSDLSIKGSNKAACNFYSLKKSEFRKLHLFDLDHSAGSLALQNIVGNSNPGPLITVHTLKDGTTRNVEVYKEDIPINRGPFCCLFIYDITEKRLLELQLEKYISKSARLIEEKDIPAHMVNRQSAAKTKNERKFIDELSFLRLINDTIAIPVLIKDKNRKIVDCNSSFEKYFSFRKKTIIGKSLFEIFSDDIACQLNNTDEEIFSNKISKTTEIIISGPSEDRKNVVVTGNLFFDEKNKPAGYVSVFVDITGFKSVEKETSNSFVKEKKINDIESRLLSTSSHEFRTPLTTILIASEVLVMVGRSWSEQRYLEQIIKIQNAVTYMTGLLDDLLLINRTDREVWKFNPSLINLHDLCQKMLEEASDQATPMHKINYEYLPAFRHAIVDEKLLQHIITNLLSNAVKYSPNGGQINFKVVQSFSNLEFVITDHGIGIPEQDRENLFETFYRCKNSTKIKGTGLGLAIVKRSVEAHGGEIKFESKLNEGSTFTVSIPLMTAV